MRASLTRDRGEVEVQNLPQMAIRVGEAAAVHVGTILAEYWTVQY